MLRRILVALLVLAAIPSAASAGAFSTFGPRIGFSTDPDQVVFGGQLGIYDVAPSLDFMPSGEVGIGDNATTVALNGDFHYRLPLEGARWEPYLGGGVTLLFVNFDNGFGDSSDTFAGGSLLFGASVPTRNGSRFFSELKVGLGDVPDLKIVAGWNFRVK